MGLAGAEWKDVFPSAVSSSSTVAALGVKVSVVCFKFLPGVGGWLARAFVVTLGVFWCSGKGVAFKGPVQCESK